MLCAVAISGASKVGKFDFKCVSKQTPKTKKPGIAFNEAGSLVRSVFSCIYKAPASWSKLALGGF
jgi:hypothetical protein